MKKIYAALMAGLLGTAALMGQAKQPQPKSQKEVEALMAIQNATTPDAKIEAVDKLLVNFADTQFKAMALLIATQSAQQKNDFEKMVIYGERTLEADPNNYYAMLMLAGGYALRTREFDLDKEEKLAKSDGYANKAMEVLKTAEKPNPQVTDEQWVATKKDLNSQAHEALANALMVRKKYDAAIAEFKIAVDSAATPEPATIARLANAYHEAGKYDLAISTAERVIGQADAHPQVKQVALQVKAKATAAKNKAAGTPPAAPAKPAAVAEKP